MKQQRVIGVMKVWQQALGALVLAAAALVAVTPAQAAGPADREYAEAVTQFKAGRHAEAFGRFIALANRGDVDAARIALFMHSFGPALYGTHWDAGVEDMEYWNTLVRNSSPASARAHPPHQPLAVVPAKSKGRQAAGKGQLKTVASTGN